MSDAPLGHMPSADEILALLTQMSRELVPLAIVWHVAILLAAVALLAGWRPTSRYALLLLAAPALSVSCASLAYGNPFNGISFAVLAIVLASFAARPEDHAAQRSSRWTGAVGVALIAFGWAYPHFSTGLAALYGSPVGLVPCPTLAVIAGFVVLAGAFASTTLALVLGAWTTFYALFGIARLGVTLDVGLLAATVALVALAVAGVSGRVVAVGKGATASGRDG